MNSQSHQPQPENQNNYFDFAAEPPIPDSISSLLIFGGSFDPPHRAHITFPKIAAQQVKADRILLIPANRSPHKMGNEAADTSADDRLKMLRLAVADTAPEISISSYEINHSPPSFTVNTLEALHKSLQSSPTAPRFFLLIGSDQALAFTRWHQWERILQLATPVILLRPPHTTAISVAESLPDSSPLKHAKVINAPLDSANSTTIRRLLQADDPNVSEFLHPAVLAYIKKHHLYHHIDKH